MTTCFPDLTLCDFYLWGSLKDKAHKINPHTLHEFKENIQQAIFKVFPASSSV
jgi:hypothetical protein